MPPGSTIILHIILRSSWHHPSSIQAGLCGLQKQNHMETSRKLPPPPVNESPSPPWKPSHQSTFFLFGNSFERCRSSQRVPNVPQRLQNGANDRQTFGRLGGRFRHPKSATCLPLSGSGFGHSGRPKAVQGRQTEPNHRQTFAMPPTRAALFRSGTHFDKPSDSKIRPQKRQTSGRPRAPKLIAMSAESLPPSGSDF